MSPARPPKVRKFMEVIDDECVITGEKDADPSLLGRKPTPVIKKEPADTEVNSVIDLFSSSDDDQEAASVAASPTHSPRVQIKQEHVKPVKPKKPRAVKPPVPAASTPDLQHGSEENDEDDLWDMMENGTQECDDARDPEEAQSDAALLGVPQALLEGDCGALFNSRHLLKRSDGTEAICGHGTIINADGPLGGQPLLAVTPPLDAKNRLGSNLDLVAEVLTNPAYRCYYTEGALWMPPAGAVALCHFEDANRPLASFHTAREVADGLDMTGWGQSGANSLHHGQLMRCYDTLKGLKVHRMLADCECNAHADTKSVYCCRMEFG